MNTPPKPPARKPTPPSPTKKSPVPSAAVTTPAGLLAAQAAAAAAEHKAAAAEHRAAVEAAAAAYKRATEAEAAVKSLEARQQALGRVSAGLVELLPLLTAHPDLAAAVLDEMKGLAPKKGKGKPCAVPSGDAIKAATVGVETAILDQLDEAFGDGRLVEVEGPGGTKVVVFYGGGTDAFLRMIAPHHFPESLPQPPPTRHPPGSPRKIAEMEARVERGEAVCGEDDADMLGAVIVNRANGSGKQVLGLAEDLGEDVEGEEE